MSEKYNDGRGLRHPPRTQNIEYPEVTVGGRTLGYLCPTKCCQAKERFFETKKLAYQHLRRAHGTEFSRKQNLTEDSRIIILYRWNSDVKAAPEHSSWVALAFSQALELRGYAAWMDRKSLPVTSAELKDSVGTAMKGKEIVVICIGVGDLKRCHDVDDFLRWEIDYARQLEEDKKLEVVIVAHGTTEPEDLICGNMKSKETREKTLESLGEWGEDFLQYFRAHYVIFLTRGELDVAVDKIISRLKQAWTRF